MANSGTIPWMISTLAKFWIRSTRASLIHSFQ
jgi:hypothetical protein